MLLNVNKFESTMAKKAKADIILETYLYYTTDSLSGTEKLELRHKKADLPSVRS